MKSATVYWIRTSGLLVMGLAAVLVAGRSFRGMTEVEPIYPSDGLTRQALLSDYFPALQDTPGDTEIYIFEGDEPGASVLIVGGTHPNEGGGYIAAVLITETLRVRSGKVIVIPRANASAFTHNDPQEGNPQRFAIETPNGKRWFRLGSRLTNPVHQWPDPTLFETSAGQIVAGQEARNLNRCYPGRADGNLTEQIAYAIMEVIRTEGVDLGMDLHESSPEYPVVDAIVFHENSADIAALAQMELQADGVDLRLEASPPNLRGLSHREWGDAAGIHAILLETPNPVQGRLKGKTSAALVTEGKDRFYVKAAGLGRLFIPFDDDGVPLRGRVARQLASIEYVFRSFAELYPDKALEVEGLPEWTRVQEEGIGPFLAR
jgi:predicted deacylase